MIATPPRDVRPTVAMILHSLELGGAEVLAATIARRLSHQFRFVFACLDDQGILGKTLEHEGFPVTVLGRKPGVDLRCCLHLSRFLRNHSVDVIHAHQYGPLFQSLAARALWRRPAIIFTEHGRPYPDYPRPKRKIVNRLLVQSRDRVIAVGNAVKQALETNEGFAPHRVEVVYNGVDLTQIERIADDTAIRAATRAAWGIDDTCFALLQVARLNALKDHHTALRMMVELGPRIPVHLFLAGDGPLRSELAAAIATHNLQGRVTLLGAIDTVPQALAACDGVLLTSISEGIPLSLIEAQAAARPIVSTDVGGVREVVVQGQQGLLAPVGDAAALATAVRQLFIHRDRSQALGQCGRMRARQHFSLDSMLKHYMHRYHDALPGVATRLSLEAVSPQEASCA